MGVFGGSAKWKKLKKGHRAKMAADSAQSRLWCHFPAPGGHLDATSVSGTPNLVGTHVWNSSVDPETAELCPLEPLQAVQGACPPVFLASASLPGGFTPLACVIIHVQLLSVTDKAYPLCWNISTDGPCFPHFLASSFYYILASITNLLPAALLHHASMNW
jgi:hypothetical protein